MWKYDLCNSRIHDTIHIYIRALRQWQWRNIHDWINVLHLAFATSLHLAIRNYAFIHILLKFYKTLNYTNETSIYSTRFISFFSLFSTLWRISSVFLNKRRINIKTTRGLGRALIGQSTSALLLPFFFHVRCWWLYKLDKKLSSSILNLQF